MVNLFEILVDVFEETVIAVFLMLYFGSKYKGFKKYAGLIATVLTAVFMTNLFNSFYTFEGILGLAYFLLYAVYAAVLLKGNIYTKIFISGFINSVINFIAIFSQILVNFISNTEIENLYIMSTERLAQIILSKILLIVACAVLLKFRIDYSGNKKSIAFLSAIPIATEISIIGIMQAFLKYSELNFDLMLASVSIMAANIAAYYVFMRINKDVEREIKIKALEQKEEYDRMHALEVEELYSKACAVRHDLLHHFTTLDGLLDGNEKAKNYIHTVIHEQMQNMRCFIKTDNECFDAIVNAKLSICDKFGIKAEIRVMDNALSLLNDYEIASLFGNLFDNAIEATKSATDKYIDLDVQIQNGHLSIFMKNSVDNPVLQGNSLPETKKSNKEIHGLGTKNIQNIVNKHKGFINYFDEDGYFNCDIFL